MFGRSKKSKKNTNKLCDTPSYIESDPLDCFLLSISGILQEHQTVNNPAKTPVRGEVTTSHTEDPSELYIIQMNIDNKSLKGLRKK